MIVFLNSVIVGIAIGSVFGLIALGYTVVHKATNVVNLAQGDLVMVGVLLAYWFLSALHWPQIVAFAGVVVALVAIACFEERIAVRPFLSSAHRGNALGWLITTLAFSLVLEGIATIRYGNNPVRPVNSFIPGESWHVGGLSIEYRMIVPVAVLVVTTAALDRFYSRTWLGVAMRASSDDRELAGLRGISPQSISRLSFAIAGAMAAVAAFAIAPIVGADPTIGLSYGLTGFVAIAIGGFGNVRGAIAGAIALGVCQQLFDVYVDPNFQDAAALGLLLLVLLVRPNGLLSSARVRTV
jgi:branched-chain amino acid transport system permease protein